MDIFSKSKRSAVMSRIRSKNTRPEMLIRKRLFAEGFRYRLYSARLPGTPDLTLARWRTVIFINGCFWHMHEGCAKSRIPDENSNFWLKKLTGNKARDTKVAEELLQSGWKVLVVWECACRKKTLDRLIDRLTEAIKSPGTFYLEIGRKDLE